ncbi:tetratricopeptide repeat protein (plasmid) [Rhodococcus pseudokoreensis]|uniref:Tetratricopeptide repeat protein n=1 Tax=Rhodococcus pseudokoreensis TaxID=2811421 RepID=A0A974ZRT6_9NOCA|nr:tetratricopeptide repeat protein [Rhodococcus pseudokoreensis]QSE87876.1 tetratricopeptide repeat protein [Rhodococcus pseudokoreensis]
MDLIDYYELLDVPRTAEAESVKTAIRNQRKDWTRKQNHPNPDVRSRAEKRIHTISEAETILLDPGRRREYDQKLAARVAEPSHPPAGGAPGRDWVAVAQGYLDSGNAVQAHLAGTEATNQNSGNPDGWYVRAQASLELENRANAEFEISEALRLSPNNPEYHCVLGDIYLDADQYDRARSSYERAQSLEPSNPFHAVGIADTYYRAHRPDLALPILEKTVEDHPTIMGIKDALAAVVISAAASQWSQHADDTATITNEAQLEVGKKALQRISQLGITDTETLADIETFRKVVVDAEQVKWFSSDSLAGYGLTVLVAAITLFVASGLISFLAFVVLIGIVALYVYRHRMPDWKWRQRKLPANVTRTGAQV